MVQQPGGEARALHIGLTGGIASGKSTVTQLLREAGLPVIDSDLLAREAVAPGSALLPRLAESFGASMLKADGTLDREALGRTVFSDPEARARLNALIHPEVQRLSALQVRALQEEGHRLIVLDVPLLYEVRDPADFDAVVVVYVDRETQLRRLMQRNGLSEADARARIQSQGSLEEKRDRADFVIDNRGTPEETRAQVRAVLAQLGGLLSEPQY